MLSSSDSYFYVFGDENQALYDQGFVSEIGGRVCSLDINCRNGSAIHDLAYRHYSGDLVYSFELPGSVIWLEANSVLEGSKIITSEIRTLLSRGVKPEEITVLVTGEPKVDYIDELIKRRLGNGLKWRSAEEEVPVNFSSEIVIDSVKRFKGLENSVVFVWGAEEADRRSIREIMYVGFSRATSLLYVVGIRAEIEQYGVSLSE